MLNVQLKRKRTFIQSMLFVVFLLSSTLAFAQNKVTGTVTDKTNGGICLILQSLDECNVKNKGRISMLSLNIGISLEKKRNNVFASIVF